MGSHLKFLTSNSDNAMLDLTGVPNCIYTMALADCVTSGGSSYLFWIKVGLNIYARRPSLPSLQILKYGVKQYFEAEPVSPRFKKVLHISSVCLWIKAGGLGQGWTRPAGRAPGRPSPSAATLTQTEGFNPIISLFFFHLEHPPKKLLDQSKIFH